MIYGSCLCGKVKYGFRGKVRLFNHCHCSMCRKAHGAAFGSFIHTYADGFEWLCGAEDIKVYRAENQDDRNFCAICGANLPVIEPADNNVIIPAGTLDTAVKIKPMAHIFVGSKAPWYDIRDYLPKFDAYADLQWMGARADCNAE